LGSGRNSIKALNLERIAFNAFKVLSVVNTLLDDKTLGKSVFQPFFVDIPLAI